MALQQKDQQEYEHLVSISEKWKTLDRHAASDHPNISSMQALGLVMHYAKKLHFAYGDKRNNLDSGKCAIYYSAPGLTIGLTTSANNRKIHLDNAYTWKDAYMYIMFTDDAGEFWTCTYEMNKFTGNASRLTEDSKKPLSKKVQEIVARIEQSVARYIEYKYEMGIRDPQKLEAEIAKEEALACLKTEYQKPFHFECQGHQWMREKYFDVLRATPEYQDLMRIHDNMYPEENLCNNRRALENIMQMIEMNNKPVAEIEDSSLVLDDLYV